MYDPLADWGVELLALIVYAAGTVALSALGLVVEYNSLQQLLGGDHLLAAWYAYVGVVALAFAASLGRKKLLPGIAAHR